MWSPIVFGVIRKSHESGFEIFAVVICMASVTCTVYAGIPYGRPASSAAASKHRRVVVVRAETVNPDIRKTEDKVVDSILVTDLSKPVTAYCRCWRSKTFPLCDGTHLKHNKATGDNVALEN